jgi:hypothetical protein
MRQCFRKTGADETNCHMKLEGIKVEHLLKRI